jgi:hypothetical protein
MFDEPRERSFDALARGLASGEVSRGKALRLMGAALVGGALASLGGVGGAAAAPSACKEYGKPCRTDAACCSGTCANGTCSVNCPSGTVLLSNGTCAIPCGNASPEGGWPECANCDRTHCGPGISSTLGGYCYVVGGSNRKCQSDRQCPQGEFCTVRGGFCTRACSSPVVA